MSLVERSRRSRLVELERRCEFLDAERRRLERLLGTTLLVAVGGTDTTPEALLDVICELDGTSPSIAAFLEERERAA